jgi:carbonic anhydrase/acetyltransferase-like protein (isoleucine patch superfamily)
MAKIHPTAIVDPKAELAQDVEIGPYVVIDGHVEVGAGTVIRSHSVLHGHTVLGKAKGAPEQSFAPTVSGRDTRSAAKTARSFQPPLLDSSRSTWDFAAKLPR